MLRRSFIQLCAVALCSAYCRLQSPKPPPLPSGAELFRAIYGDDFDTLCRRHGRTAELAIIAAACETLSRGQTLLLEVHFDRGAVGLLSSTVYYGANYSTVELAALNTAASPNGNWLTINLLERKLYRHYATWRRNWHDDESRQSTSRTSDRVIPPENFLAWVVQGLCYWYPDILPLATTAMLIDGSTPAYIEARVRARMQA